MRDRQEDRAARWFADVLILAVLHNAHDLDPVAIGNQRPTERAVTRPELLGQCLVDDDHRRAAGSIARIEHSSLDEPRACGLEVLGTDVGLGHEGRPPVGIGRSRLGNHFGGLADDAEWRELNPRHLLHARNGDDAIARRRVERQSLLEVIPLESGSRRRE